MYIVIAQAGFPSTIGNVLGEEQINLSPSDCPHIHKTLDLATQEAAKLTQKHKVPFYVFCAVGFYKPGEPVPPPVPVWESML